MVVAVMIKAVELMYELRLSESSPFRGLSSELGNCIHGGNVGFGSSDVGNIVGTIVEIGVCKMLNP